LTIAVPQSNIHGFELLVLSFLKVMLPQPRRELSIKGLAVFSIVPLVLFCCLIPAAGQQPLVVMVPDGTAVRLSLEEALNSATSEAGDQVRLRVSEDVRVGSVLVIPSGSPAVGHIVTDEKKKTLGRGGKIDFAVDYVKPGNLGQVRVRATAKRAGKDSTGSVIALTVLISPLFLLKHGHDVVIPRDTTFTAYIDGEQDVSILPGNGLYPNQGVATVSAVSSGRSVAQPVTDPSPAVPTTQEGLATVKLKSQPDGAEISVDGDFVGDAPSTLKLEAGHHTIVVTKPGYKNWQRSISVGSGAEISLEADLEKNP